MRLKKNPKGASTCRTSRSEVRLKKQPKVASTWRTSRKSDQISSCTGKEFFVFKQRICFSGNPHFLQAKLFFFRHTSILMVPARETMEEEVVRYGSREFVLTLAREDFSSVYPRMMRYTLSVREGDTVHAVFRTNTFEYSPMVPLAAESAARDKKTAWVRGFASDPEAIFSAYPPDPPDKGGTPANGVVIIQGSPRPDGNCSILAGWAADAVREAGRTVQIMYPHDLDIHCCIGCYQCYNTGTCVFDDDMKGIIDAVRGARLLIICSPVYTNTVPAGLKLVIDRMQAYHAEKTLYGDLGGKKGILFSVAGRKGEPNFSCITKVILPFFRNLGIEPAGQVLIDSTDAVRDIRILPGRNDAVKQLVTKGLLS